ncbi:unnamed protein product [Nesidiocoris tenuis]|uniref:Uncharacterized protein n=1 Tax=Nesidiocoris tenuis TaxID=355587 RepID=A0A6H5GWM7_9HEMI|nr:unnamed protein product [Nesidiocoris tenuis]
MGAAEDGPGAVRAVATGFFRLGPVFMMPHLTGLTCWASSGSSRIFVLRSRAILADVPGVPTSDSSFWQSFSVFCVSAAWPLSRAGSAEHVSFLTIRSKSPGEFFRRAGRAGWSLAGRAAITGGGMSARAAWTALRSMAVDVGSSSGSGVPGGVTALSAGGKSTGGDSSGSPAGARNFDNLLTGRVRGGRIGRQLWRRNGRRRVGGRRRSLAGRRSRFFQRRAGRRHRRAQRLLLHLRVDRRRVDPQRRGQDQRIRGVDGHPQTERVSPGRGGGILEISPGAPARPAEGGPMPHRRFPRSARCGEEIMRSGGSESRQGAKVSGNLGFPERQSRLDATRTRNSEEPKMRTVDEERRRRDICLCGSSRPTASFPARAAGGRGSTPENASGEGPSPPTPAREDMIKPSSPEYGPSAEHRVVKPRQDSVPPALERNPRKSSLMIFYIGEAQNSTGSLNFIIQQSKRRNARFTRPARENRKFTRRRKRTSPVANVSLGPHLPIADRQGKRGPQRSFTKRGKKTTDPRKHCEGDADRSAGRWKLEAERLCSALRIRSAALGTARRMSVALTSRRSPSARRTFTTKAPRGRRMRIADCCYAGNCYACEYRRERGETSTTQWKTQRVKNSRRRNC